MSIFDRVFTIVAGNSKKQNETNTLVIDQAKGFGLEYVEKPEGHLWRYQGKPIYLMVRKNGSLKPITMPLKMEDMPEKLWRALNWKEVRDLYIPPKSTMEKLQTMLWFAVVGLLGFIIFMIIASVMG